MMRGQILRQHGRVSCFTGGTGRISSLWVTTPGSATAAGSGGRTKASQSPTRRFLWRGGRRGARRLGRIRGWIGGSRWFHHQRFMAGNGRQGMFGRRRVIGTGQGKASTSSSAGTSGIALFFRAGTGQGMDRFLTGATGFSHRCRITARSSSSLVFIVAHQGSQAGGLAVVVVVVIGFLLQVTTWTLTSTPQAIGTQSRSSSCGWSRWVGCDSCLFVG